MLVAVNQRLPSVTCHLTPLLASLRDSLLLQSQQERESFLAKWATVLHNVVTYMYSSIFYHICCIPLVRSKSQVPLVLKGKGSHKKWAPGSWDQGDHCGVYVPQLENCKMYMSSKVGWNSRRDIIPRQAHTETLQKGKRPASLSLSIAENAAIQLSLQTWEIRLALGSL